MQRLLSVAIHVSWIECAYYVHPKLLALMAELQKYEYIFVPPTLSETGVQHICVRVRYRHAADRCVGAL